MPIGLTPEQRDLEGAIARFAGRHAGVGETRATLDAIADGHLPAWWDELVTLGFHAVHLSDSVGGQGGELIDAACVVEAAATALLPGPLLPTVITGAVAGVAGDDPAAVALAVRLAEGVTAATILPGHGN